jgi:pyroglutamyl-peptidase
MVTVLITGFGPFPGMRANPTEPLVAHLARLRRPALRDVRLVGHVFPTRYAAVDEDLPKLIAQHRPDALLMFGVAPRRRHISIETRARNALALLPDAGSASLGRHAIGGDLPERRMPAPVRHLLRAARAGRLAAALSHDAGKYLCNYLCWRAAEAVTAGRVPRLAAFVHVPQVPCTVRPCGAGPRPLAAADLARAGERILIAVAAAARR